MKAIDRSMATVDSWQRSHRLTAVAYGVAKKFGDDNANQFVVGLGWYGFVAIYPLLLVVTTVLGFIGAASLGHHLVSTLHEFPVVGTQFNPGRGSSSLHGSTVGLVIGLLGLLYGAQGVTQTAQQAMLRVWNIPQLDAPGFLPRLGRSLAGLATIGGAFVLNAATATFAVSSGLGYPVRGLVLLGMVAMNMAFYLLAFRVLTPTHVGTLALLPGASLGAIGFTFLITLGAGLVEHQVKHSSATYGQFGVVIGLVGFLFLLAKLSLYGAELNPVLSRKLWPRALESSNPTEADDRVLHDITHENQRRQDQRIGVGFGEHAQEQAEQDARQGGRTLQSVGSDGDAGPPSPTSAESGDR